MKPQFPLYIPSKGRYEYMITSKILTNFGVKHFIVVEEQEIEKYNNAVNEMKLLATIIKLDMNFKKNYELCDNIGIAQSTGSGPARNFAWEHSIQNGYKWHWLMDDNITSFVRFNKNRKIKVSNGAIFRAMEDFCLRYNNIAMAGPNYRAFIAGRSKYPPFYLNTRVYSCNLIRNDINQRWRGRHNEDTILSLDILKAGWCTILFNAFLQEKMQTQLLKGGNTSEFYHTLGKYKKGEKYTKTGTLDKSKLLVKVHPDVARIAYRFNRIHHYVDYSIFKKNKLIRDKNIKIQKGINNYGMILKDK